MHKAKIFTLGCNLVESEIEELNNNLKKKFLYNRYCSFYKDDGRKCYFHSIYNTVKKCHYVLNESKKLSDLSDNIDYENNWTYINNLLENCENDQVFYSKHGCKCPETRKFPIGTLTNHGVVLANNSEFYYTKYENVKYGGINGTEFMGTYSYGVFHWHDVFDVSKCSEKRLQIPKNIINYYNTSLETLYGKEWHFGVDRNPKYQRGDVWSQEQKEALIDSIFNRIPIGAMIFARRDWKDGERMDEIVDGKQRYTTIIDFVSDRFRYRGMLYSELNPRDRNEFDDSQVMLGEIIFRDGYDEKQVIETFIRLNIGGTSMDGNVIEKAKEMINER